MSLARRALRLDGWIMVKVTLGDKGERLKWNLYFFGILLILCLGSCLVCTRLMDWSGVQRRELEKYFLQFEEKILLENSPKYKKPQKLWSECNKHLRSQWLVGFFVENNKKGSFCGRPAPEFWRAVNAQREAIIAGKPFDKKKIPRYRMTVEFKKLNCRLLIGEASMQRDSNRQR